MVLFFATWSGVVTEQDTCMDNDDPMHGAYLHKQSHTMADGDITAEFQNQRHRAGFSFEKRDNEM
jgi:phenylpropionate dioxygenase-like ring-hydroxylating dioxygenase large terminal subunit